MKNYVEYVEKFKECSRENYKADPWEYKIINKNYAKMEKIVKKIFERNEEKQFFEEMFASDEIGIRRWAACFSEVFNYDLYKSYEVFLEQSKAKKARPTDITGAKIAVERLEKKIKEMEK